MSRECPVWLKEIWAKSPAEPEQQGETLFAHTLLVMKKLAEMTKLRATLPDYIAFPRLWHCLFWAIWLHDFGKAAEGFQVVLRSKQGFWPHRHEVLSLAFLDWIDGILTDEEKCWVAAAIVFHHKDAEEICNLALVMDGSEDDPTIEMVANLNDDTIEKLWNWIKDYCEAWISDLGLTGNVYPVNLPPLNVENFRKLAPRRIRRYLNNITNWLEELENTRAAASSVLVRGHVINADHSASAHIGALTSPLGDYHQLLAQWGKVATNLYQHQLECIGADGSTVLIAPTGSGKTEAALLWATTQKEANQPLARLLYCLPYQASMNAMYNRLQETSFPGMVGLEHSRSIMAVYSRFLEDHDNYEARHKAKLEKTLAKLYYYPVRVLSPYQILKGPYRLKGYETLLTDCCQAACVLDEVHAYEPRRLAVILATVKYLRKNLGTRFFIMSATLPTIVREKLRDALGAYNIVHASEETFSMFRRHKVFVKDGDMLDINWHAVIETDVDNGNSVLICCNTIKRAQQMYDAVKARLASRNIAVVLLHGRFNGQDRLYKEQLIQNMTGSNSKQRQPIVLVATQVVEVSLDIDLDVIYTDPAPLEALIQRFGRVNRRRLKDWAPVYVFTKPKNGQYVYKDDLIIKSVAGLKKLNGQFIEESSVTGFLDEIYTGDLLQQWDNDYYDAYQEFQAVCLDSLKAFNSEPHLEELFYRAFDSVEVLPQNLVAEYQEYIKSDNPLEASRLLVAISWRKLCELRKRKVVQEKVKSTWASIVNLDYNSETGLEL